MPHIPVRVLFAALLSAGCASSRVGWPDPLARVNSASSAEGLQPQSAATASIISPARGSATPGVDSQSENGLQLVASFSPADAPPAEGSSAAARSPNTNGPARAPAVVPDETVPTNGTQVGQITLPDAIQIAYRTQPRLRVFLEGIHEAQGNADIAFSPYLPTLAGGISGGGFDLNVQGQATGFSFLPPGAVVPIGLNLDSGYGLGDVRLQWLICDFGRREGRYCQAKLGVEIASLQSDRAYQTVANEVAGAYYQVLRATSLRRIAQEAVRRADDDLGVARKLQKGGVIEREKVLRAEVQLAQSQRLLDSAEGALAIAIAAINVAMGVDVSSPTSVAEVSVMPPPPESLSDCLQLTAAQRRELNVARCGVQVAQEGERVAKADFLPKIIAEGDYLNFEQTTPRANVGLGLGFIKLEWGLFEGGRRIGELKVADSKTRAAMALAQSIADTISFQTVEAYHQMVTALKAIELAKPAVTQAQENYRLVKARAAQGDATATELTDAETALTRAEQDHLNSIYDYLTARARLDYAMGQTPGGGGP
jgi:outer membrane protein TolC